jgi:hypothetical protein
MTGRSDGLKTTSGCSETTTWRVGVQSDGRLDTDDPFMRVEKTQTGVPLVDTESCLATPNEPCHLDPCLVCC